VESSIIPPERTEVYYGQEDAMKILLQAMANVKKEAVVCSDANSPAFSMGVEPVKKGFIDFKKRGVKIRQIVEITKDNLEYCKEFMNYVELRHMDNVKGNMAVSETEYVATAVLEGAVPVTQTIYSNVKAFLEQQRYFFENLWSKAIPAEQKIREIEEGIEPTYTIVLDSPEEILGRIRKRMQNSTELMVCAGVGGLEFVYRNLLDEYRQAFKMQKEGKHKGIRWIIPVNGENLALVKLFVNEGLQIRHIKDMPPLNFAIDGKVLHATIESMEGGKMTGNFLISSEPPYLYYFKSIFEELWKQGMDVQDRILELEKGIEPANVEIISNPKESIKRAWDLIRSAKQDVMVMLSSPTAFRRQLAMGGLEVIQQAVKNGAKVKLLIPSDRDVAQTLCQVKSALPQAEFRAMDASLTTSITIVLVDRKECMFFELKDDSATDSRRAVGLALYSDSKSIVSSYISILDAIWKQSELNEQIRQANEKLEDAYRQLEEHEKVQKEFINIAAHELRTPVQPLLGISELLQQSMDGKDKAEITKDELEMLVRNAKRLERLSSDILEVSRIESKSLTLNKERVNLNEKIRNVIKDVKSFIPNNKHVEIVFDSKATSPTVVEADKSRLFGVLSNILKNAIKFTDEGTIRITLEERDGQAIVCVRDTGRGIDPEIFPKLFAKFVTKSEQGTGLGLYLSKGFIEAHGGGIWAENNKDRKGATFTFTLPLTQHN